MTTQAKAAGLTLLLVVLAGVIWIAIYLWHEQPTDQRSSVPISPNKVATTTVPLGIETVGLSLELKQDNLLRNPFVLKGSMNHPVLDWQVQDSQGIVVASGSVQKDDSGKFETTNWYLKRPTDQRGTIVFIKPGSPLSVPVFSLPVELQTGSQTAEIYLHPTGSKDCRALEPVRRTVVSTDGEKADFYEAAIRALLVGPTDEESKNGLASAIPHGAKLLRVGQDEKGRFTADFDASFTTGSACDAQAAKAQIVQTLVTVPLDGAPLVGRLFVEGKEVDF